MRTFLVLCLTIIFFLNLTFAATLTINTEFNNSKTIARTGQLNWFIEPINGSKAIDVSSYCLEGQTARSLTLPAKSPDGTPGNANRTCTINDPTVLNVNSYYTYATFSYLEDGTYYTYTGQKSKAFTLISPYSDTFKSTVRWLKDNTQGRTCDKNDAACLDGYFCYLTDPATAKFNTVDLMKPQVTGSNDFGYVDPDQLDRGCLMTSSKELFTKLGTKSIFGCSEKCGFQDATCGDKYCNKDERCSVIKEGIISSDCGCVKNTTCYQEKMDVFVTDLSTGKVVADGGSGSRKISLKLSANYSYEGMLSTDRCANQWTNCAVRWLCDKSEAYTSNPNGPVCCSGEDCVSTKATSKMTDGETLDKIWCNDYTINHEYDPSETGDKYIYVSCDSHSSFISQSSKVVKYTIKSDCPGKIQADCTEANGCFWSNGKCYKNTGLKVKSVDKDQETQKELEGLSSTDPMTRDMAAYDLGYLWYNAGTSAPAKVTEALLNLSNDTSEMVLADEALGHIWNGAGTAAPINITTFTLELIHSGSTNEMEMAAKVLGSIWSNIGSSAPAEVTNTLLNLINDKNEWKGALQSDCADALGSIWKGTKSSAPRQVMFSLETLSHSPYPQMASSAVGAKNLILGDMTAEEATAYREDLIREYVLNNGVTESEAEKALYGDDYNCLGITDPAKCRGSCFWSGTSCVENTQMEVESAPEKIACPYLDDQGNRQELEYAAYHYGPEMPVPGSEDLFDKVNYGKTYQIISQCQTGGKLAPFACRYYPIDTLQPNSYFTFGQSRTFSDKGCPGWGLGIVGCWDTKYTATCSESGVTISKI